MFKTDCDFKMSEISNIACRWVKTMPEVLKPRPLHVHGNFVFSVCKLKKARKGHEVKLMAIIQFGEAQSFTQNMYGKRNLGP